MRTAKETNDICAVFNLPQSVVSKYVQFGEVFNLLHAGASILRIHQKGFGAVGVSKKYGKRSWARYPILWGLPSVGALPNPDPSDVDALDKNLAGSEKIEIDQVFETARPVSPFMAENSGQVMLIVSYHDRLSRNKLKSGLDWSSEPMQISSSSWEDGLCRKVST